jgi:hypothetical protein
VARFYSLGQASRKKRFIYNSYAMLNIKIDDLVCPMCKNSLVLNEAKATLKCVQCHRAYPVRDEIPILLEEEAVIEEP